jgi:hypothetical protein
LFQKIVVDKGFMLSKESVDMLDQFIEHYQKKPNFGHRRTIRNLVEKVIIEHICDLPEDGKGLPVTYMRTIQYTSLIKVQFSERTGLIIHQAKYS